MESIKNNSEYAEFAETLQKIMLEESGGRTVEYINWIVDDLRKGDMERAKADYRNQSDKYGSWPEAKEFLKKIGVVEEIDWSKLRDEK